MGSVSHRAPSESPSQADNISVNQDADAAPYTLPPGPRTTSKPGVSYAALIGQAILSARVSTVGERKKLTLAQIYAWISAAWPFYKAGESGESCDCGRFVAPLLWCTDPFAFIFNDIQVGRTRLDTTLV